MWTLIIPIIVLVIFLCYNAFINRSFGVPNSLSATYYLCKEKNNKIGFLFPTVLFTVVALLMPVWLEISENSNFQFMSFLSAGSLMFTALTPAFRKDIMTKRIHNISAIIGVIFAFLWIIFVAHLWQIIILFLIIFLYLAFVTKTLWYAKIYWLEMMAFITTIFTIIIKNFQCF